MHERGVQPALNETFSPWLCYRPLTQPEILTRTLTLTLTRTLTLTLHNRVRA